MASIMAAGSAISTSARPVRLPRSQLLQAVYRTSGLKSVSFISQKKIFSPVWLQPSSSRLRVSSAAKPETLEKVCDIVRKQLALPDDSNVTGDSKFSALGADSLDTVEIVMGLEEAFGISVEEESAQSIATVQDAADLIEKLAESKSD